MWFSHPLAESVGPQLYNHNPVSYRSLPTSSSCYCGQSSSLVLSATAPFPVLVGKQRETEVWKRYGIVGKTEKRKKQRGKAYVKTAQRRSERQRKQPAHVHEADGVSL